jgi:hypothetical protein
MVNIINSFDLFGKSISFYTKSSSKVTTWIGFTLSVVSVFLFCLIFYFEAYEVFSRENPNIVSYKQNIYKNNSTLSINKDTFNFFITLYIDFPEEKLFQNFLIVSYFEFRQETKKSFSAGVRLEKCNENDKSYFSSYSDNFDFPKKGINLCLRSNFADIENVKSFREFHYQFHIKKCEENFPSCTVDEELYTKPLF